MPAWLIPAAIQGVSAVAGYMSRRKQPGFNQTAQGRYLSKVSKQGVYTPKAQSEILGKTSAQAGNVAQTDITARRGYLEARGMGNSIAGARTLAEPRLNQAEIVSNAANELSIKNEQSKIDAQNEYALARMRYGKQGRAEENQAREKLISGIGNTINTAAQGYMQKRMYDKSQTALESLGDVDLSKMSDGEILQLSQKYGIKLEDLLKMKQGSESAIFQSILNGE